LRNAAGVGGRQQALDLELEPAYDYGAWVRHAGTERAQNHLALWLVHGGTLWLTSDKVAGKTHLLHALAQEHPYLGLIDAAQGHSPHATALVRNWLQRLVDCAAWMVDAPPRALSETHAIALFHLIERAREMKRPILIAWRRPPGAPPELESRLDAMVCVHIEPPAGEADLLAVLKSVAAARQWPVDEDLLRYIVTHRCRSLPALLAVLEELEHRARDQRRRMTLAWGGKQLRSIPDIE